MEIVLIRHGKPKIDISGNMSAADFGKRVADYDRAGIDAGHRPANDACERAQKCLFIVCSTLPRSIESARALNIENPNMISYLFRECEMPCANWKYPKLSGTSWSVLFRILQLAGYSSNTESRKAIKNRTKECADRLVKLSREHGSVLFVGHGTIIWFIHRQLLRAGWSGPQKSVKKYWEFGVYTQNITGQPGPSPDNTPHTGSHTERLFHMYQKRRRLPSPGVGARSLRYSNQLIQFFPIYP